MSHEVYEIVKKMNLKDIETQLALQCASLITGLKISNLLILSSENERVVKSILNKSMISYYRLLKNDEKITYLLFKRQELERVIKDEDVWKIFRSNGYKTLHIGKILRTFQLRYEDYVNGNIEFPHEMGLLLEYPVEDVVGFVDNKGKNFLYSGYWKVYKNMKEKVKLFRKFEVAEETLIHMVSNGVSIIDIIDIYNT